MHDEIKLTDAQQFVLAHIPHGRDNRIARVWLQRRVGKSDRLIRRMISDMREMGVPIMSTSHLDGYWIPTQSEMERDSEIYLREINSRIEQISRSAEWAIRAQRQLQKGDHDHGHLRLVPNHHEA